MEGAAMFILVVGVAINPRKGADISPNRDIWPVLGEDGSAVGVDFAEGDGSHSGSFEAKAESSDAAE
jgi:hypothetical protein